MPKEVKEKVSKKAPAAKTEKKKKDPNAPKRGLSAFMFFSNDKREEIKAANPGIAFGQVGKKAGEMWNALSEKEKEPYAKRAQKDKERYEREKAAYEAKPAPAAAESESDE